MCVCVCVCVWCVAISLTVIVLFNFKTESARLHLIIQFPVLQTSGSSQDTNYLVKRQQEYVYCLQQNLLSPHVSSLACVLKILPGEGMEWATNYAGNILELWLENVMVNCWSRVVKNLGRSLPNRAIQTTTF